MTTAKFSGDVLKWQTFYESFTTAIHNKPNISNVQKFNYLVGYLEGQAKRTVEEFNITNENYQKALDLGTIWEYSSYHYNSYEQTFEDQICEIG